MKSLIYFTREYPLIFYATVLSLGQGCGVALDLSPEKIIGISLLLIPLFLWCARMCLVGSLISLVFLCGALSGLTALPPLIDPIAADKKIFLVTANDTPRFKRQGEVHVGLSFLQYYDSQKIRWFIHSKPFSLQCRARDLPWRSIGSALEDPFFVVKANIFPFDSFVTPLSYQGSAKRAGYSGSCQILYVARASEREPYASVKVRKEIREKIAEATDHSEAGGLVLSMVWGIGDTLSRITDDAFMRTGLTHILVVSGAQIVMLFFALRTILLLLFTRVILRNPRTVQVGVGVAGSLLCALFVVITGAQTPALRALIGIVVWILSGLFDRGERPSARLVTTYLILQILFPASWLDPGVQLTFGALVGLSMGKGITRIGRYLSSCWYAWIATSAISLLWFNQLSLIGVVINPLLVPLVSAIGMYGGVLSTLLLFCVPMVGRISTQIIANFLWYFVMFLRWCTEFEYGFFAIEGWARWLCMGTLVALFMKRVIEKLMWSLQRLPRGVYI